jgi:hypothetical protein
VIISSSALAGYKRASAGDVPASRRRLRRSHSESYIGVGITASVLQTAAACPYLFRQIWLPSTTGAVFLRATDPSALGGSDPDCPVTGDARTAMPSVIRIAIRFVSMLDLTQGYDTTSAVATFAFAPMLWQAS